MWPHLSGCKVPLHREPLLHGFAGMVGGGTQVGHLGGRGGGGDGARRVGEGVMEHAGRQQGTVRVRNAPPTYSSPPTLPPSPPPHLHRLGGLLGLHLVRAVHNDAGAVLELPGLKQLDDRLHRAAGPARAICMQHLHAFREG